MAKRFPDWLDELIGGHEIADEGVELPKRGTLDFVGAGVTVTDDSGNGKTIVTISGSAISATGTGFAHVTGGVMDGAARAIDFATGDVTGILPITKGGTGLSAVGSANKILYSTGAALAYAFLVNANVDAAAAIAGTKIAPDFGAQLVQTTGGVRGGYVELTSGGPKITKGAGAPAASDPNGSLYLRTDGTSSTTAYVRAAGAWTALGGGGGGSASSGYDTADHGGGGQEVVNITGTGGIAKVRSTAALVFGDSGYATIGRMRLPVGVDGTGSTYTSFVAMRNKAADDDINLAGGRYNTDFASEELIFGDFDNLGAAIYMQSGGVAIGISGTTSQYPIVTDGETVTLGVDTATGTPLAFGSTASHTGLIRMPRPPETGVVADRLRVIALRNFDDSDDLTLVTAWKKVAGSLAFEIGDDGFHAYFKGNSCYLSLAQWGLGEPALAVTAEDGTPIPLQFGDGSAGTIIMRTGAGAPAPADPDGSVYFRNDGTNGATGVYTRQGGVWYAVGGGSSSGVTWSTDLNGSTDTIQKVVQITGSANVCNVISTTRLAFLGSSPVSTNAKINATTATTIVGGRRADNLADISILAWLSSNLIQLGGNGGLGVAPIIGSDGGFIEVGLGVATAGGVRLANNKGGVVFAKAGGGNITGVDVDGSNNVLLGSSASVGTYVDSGTTTGLRVNATNVLTCTSSFITAALPVDIGASGYIRAGAGAASVGGYLRVPVATPSAPVAPIAHLAATFAGVLQPIVVTSSDAVFLGNSPTNTLVQSTVQVDLRVGGTSQLTQTSSLTSIATIMQLVNAAAPTGKPSGGPKVWGDAGRLAFWGSNTPSAGKEVRIAYDSMQNGTLGPLATTVKVVCTDHNGVPSVVGAMPIYLYATGGAL